MLDDEVASVFTIGKLKARPQPELRKPEPAELATEEGRKTHAMDTTLAWLATQPKVMARNMDGRPEGGLRHEQPLEEFTVVSYDSPCNFVYDSSR